MTEELLAQLIEEVSVLAADRRRKEPRQVPRPYDAPEPKTGVTGNATTGIQARGLDGMIGAARMLGMMGGVGHG